MPSKSKKQSKKKSESEDVSKSEDTSYSSQSGSASDSDDDDMDETDETDEDTEDTEDTESEEMEPEEIEPEEIEESDQESADKSTDQYNSNSGEEADADVDIEYGDADMEPDTTEPYAPESKKCYMKNLDKDFVVSGEDDSHLYGKMKWIRIPDEDRITDAVMTYYEMTRVIGTRAQQFNLGAPPLVEGIDDLNPPKMAYVELLAKQTPYIIRRFLPGKLFEDWKISELDIIHVISDDHFVPRDIDWEAILKKSNSQKKKK